MSAPTCLADTFLISVVAQLGPDQPEDAAGTHWKIDMYDFEGSDTWKAVGDLTGGEGAAPSGLSLSVCPSASRVHHFDRDFV